MIIFHPSQNYKKTLDQWKQDQINAGFRWKGKVFQIDEQSLMFMQGRLQEINLIRKRELEKADFNWRTADNSFYKFTAEEFEDFYCAVSRHVSSILEAVWKKKDNHPTPQNSVYRC